MITNFTMNCVTVRTVLKNSRISPESRNTIESTLHGKFYSYLLKNTYCTPSKGTKLFKSNHGNLKSIFSEENRCIVQKKLSSVTLPRKVKLKDDARLASVLVPLCSVNDEPSMLFMVRPMTMPQHRGEVCFPGGKMDESDHDIVHTALRESHEEIGLQEENVDVWGQMTGVPSRKDGMLNVIPVIGYCGEIDLKSLHLNRTEVDAVFTTSLLSLCRSVRSTQFRTNINATTGYTLPVYTGGEQRIWGLTAIFIHQLLPLLIPDLYNFKLKHR